MFPMYVYLSLLSIDVATYQINYFSVYQINNTKVYSRNTPKTSRKQRR
ncbi:unnamed protein product [Larinioides sclopetarius]|uniref:Uncharacterized protein n=1 Tax=Larinioides sclopetarius TaxID=280406 RepID=A0AAV2AQH9_9ARAC